MIDLVGYDEKENILEVRFIKSGNQYRYFGVPKQVHKRLMKASSKGTYMHVHILEQYDYAMVKGKRERNI